jgi:hypothetical protein
MMKDVLELEFQLQMIDYTKPNFVHADMSPAQFAESMKAKGESVFSMFLKMMNYSMSQQNAGAMQASNADLMSLFDSKKRSMTLKRLFAEQLQSMGGMTTALEGPKGSTLITGRNKIALDVLRKQIDDGKKKIAVFYGGGHMPDLDKHLRDDFNLVPDETRWLTAWDLHRTSTDEKKKFSRDRAPTEGWSGSAEGEEK